MEQTLFDFTTEKMPILDNLTQVQKACWQHAENAGFHEVQRGVKTNVLNYCIKAALVNTEVSEIIEDLRRGDFVNGREEIADAIIRLFDLDMEILMLEYGETALTKNLVVESLATIIYNKMQTNLTRGVRHGGKLF